MSAPTLDFSPLMVHVPVDRIDIVYGPPNARCRRAFYELAERVVEADVAGETEATYVELLFTLKTAASAATFRRGIKMTNIYNFVRGHSFSFTAIFCGRVVSGVYDIRTRTGWFNLD